MARESCNHGWGVIRERQRTELQTQPQVSSGTQPNDDVSTLVNRCEPASLLCLKWEAFLRVARIRPESIAVLRSLATSRRENWHKFLLHCGLESRHATQE